METEDLISLYFNKLSDAAVRIADGKIDLVHFLSCTSPTELARSLVGLRHQFIVDSDVEDVRPFLESDDLSAWEFNQRPAVLLVWDDIVSECRRIAVLRACETYSLRQPLFEQSPTISELIDWDAPPELLLINDLPWVDDHSGFLAANRDWWGRPSILLRDELITYLRRRATTFEVAIRLDTYTLTPANVFSVQEAIVRQADPKWWQKLAIHPGGKKYSEYKLDGTGSLWEQNDYRQGVRRLEVSFLRRNSGQLMASIEELARYGPNLLIGLMLHCDSSSPIGTDWDSGVLGHIDGAINIYTEAVALERFEQRHTHGKVINASIRTHLFRINCVPVRVITELAQLFFHSESLIQEWLRDQFGT